MNVGVPQAAGRTSHMTIPAKLGFVGAGAITSAIVTGLRSSRSPQHAIWLSPRNPQIAADLAARFPLVSVASSNQAVLDASDTLVLAIRPQIAREALDGLRFRPDHRVISLVSSLSLRSVCDSVSPATRVSRAVPLPSAAMRRSPTAVYPADLAALDLFGAVGSAFAVDTEREFNALCAATACIASYFAFAESIASWLAGQGIAREAARDYIARIFSGLAPEASESRSFQSLAADHATAGGLNQQLLAHLGEQRVFESVSQGLDAVMHRITSASRHP